MQYVIFELANQEFAVEIEYVNEISEYGNITKVPQEADYLEGVLDLRGNIIPIINLKKKLKLGNVSGASRQILIITFKGIQIGIIIDNANDVKNFDRDVVKHKHPALRDANSSFKGIIQTEGSLILLLDIEKVFKTFENEIIDSRC